MANRWAERVRITGHPDAANLLERWLEAEGGWSALLAASGARAGNPGDVGPDVDGGGEDAFFVAPITVTEPGTGERTQGAFVRLGGVACDAGLTLDAVRDIMLALGEVVPGEPGESAAPSEPPAGRAPGVPVGRFALLHGLAAGGWHAGCGPAHPRTGTGGSIPVPGTVDEAAPIAAFPALDPELAKLIRHDIKTPLQAASLNLELLAMEQEGNPSVTGAIETIMQSLDSAVAMLQRFDDA